MYPLIPIKFLCFYRVYRSYIFLAGCLVGITIFPLAGILRAWRAGQPASEIQRPFRRLNEFRSIFRMLQTLNITLVLLDPKLLDSGETSRKSAMPHLVTVGIFEKDSQKLQAFDQWHILLPRWWYTHAVGTDYRYLRPKEVLSSYRDVTTHHFFISATSILHVAVVFLRNDFYWVAGIEESSVARRFGFLANLTYDIPLAMAVDKFDCAPTLLLPGYKMCVPENLDYYIWQLPQAKFVECHYQTIVYPFKRQYQMLENDTGPQREALKEVFELAKHLRIRLMIGYGTLLGWYRQCDYIVESLDLDTLVMHPDWKLEMLHSLFKSDVLSMQLRLGSPNLGYQLRMQSQRGVWLDIFFMYPKSENQSIVHVLNTNFGFTMTYPSIKGVCSCELLGLLVYLPCNYEEYIRAEYGTDGWFKPVRGIRHRNLIMEDYFDEVEMIYLNHGYSNFTCDNPNMMWGCDPVPVDVMKSTVYQNETRLMKGVLEH